MNTKCPTDDEDLIEHITTLIDELKEMGASADDDNESGNDNNIIISVKKEHNTYVYYESNIYRSDLQDLSPK